MASEGRTWRWLIPRAVWRLPADLAAVLMIVGLTNLIVFAPVISETPLRVVFGLPFVLFVPGYAFIAALFPEQGDSVTEESDTEDASREPDTDTAPADGPPVARARAPGIDGIERVALSFGLSIAVVPLIGLVLNFTPFGIRLAPIMVSVSGFTVICVWIAMRQRTELPRSERFSVPYREWYATGRAELLEPDSRADLALNVLLVCSVLLAASSVGYAIAVPSQGEAFTELYLLTESQDGELVAENYPTEFQPEQSRSVIVGIGNHEHEPVNYTVVAQIQRVSIDESGNETTITVRDRSELGRLRADLGDNETYREPFEIAPELTGTDLRVVFLLYQGNPPGQPTVANAYIKTHLWVNVTAPG